MNAIDSAPPSVQHKKSLKNLPAQGAIFFLRLSIGLMGLTHGYPKLLMLLEGEGHRWLDPFGWGATLSLILCTCAEFVASIGLSIGFMTRICALILFINFYVIVFVTDIGIGWRDNEVATLYLIIYLSLLGLGGGLFSLDTLIQHRTRKKHTPQE